MSKRVLKTKLCDMLGIEYPILSAGMGPTLIGEKTGAPVELVVALYRSDFYRYAVRLRR